jgi:hypothetical protein
MDTMHAVALKNRDPTPPAEICNVHPAMTCTSDGFDNTEHGQSVSPSVGQSLGNVGMLHPHTMCPSEH